jgi:hypothetical protein
MIKLLERKCITFNYHWSRYRSLLRRSFYRGYFVNFSACNYQCFIFTGYMRLSIFFILALASFYSLAQSETDSAKITISGYALDSNNPGRRLDDLMIINLRTSQGAFGRADGYFKVDVLKADTFLVASTGYEYKRLCFKDSVYKPNYYITVPIIKLNVTLKEVNIFSHRDLQSIYTDIQKLGYNKRDFELSGVDALSSPITFLYQEFSALERLKRHNAERINTDKRKELLRQLFANYVAHDIINLDNNEFDDFINFCDVPENYLKTASQYDFCIYIKQRFEVYAMMKRK